MCAKFCFCRTVFKFTVAAEKAQIGILMEFQSIFPYIHSPKGMFGNQKNVILGDCPSILIVL